MTAMIRAYIVCIGIYMYIHSLHLITVILFFAYNIQTIPKHATPWSPDRSPDVFSPAPSERTWKDPICDINLYKWSINRRFHFLISLNKPQKTSGYTWWDISVQERKMRKQLPTQKNGWGSISFWDFLRSRNPRVYVQSTFQHQKIKKTDIVIQYSPTLKSKTLLQLFATIILLQGFREASLHLS